ncbi:hypothetical protein [Hyphomicrobium sp.]|uniref:hypothetical protein n=1 Tax=Hyphomicrobium sp. TaxID=82 RepID=UPI000FB35650|nr:hypothetical protein [Hyphomicrobium sp.]RUO97683.1 MAG: hypothetical protein EKK30_13030 [Hyphomicrobium sp.]
MTTSAEETQAPEATPSATGLHKSTVVRALFVNIVACGALLWYDLGFDHHDQLWWPDSFAFLTNLLAGGLVSFFFYWLVVYVPEMRRKKIIKTNLLRMYRDVKWDIILNVVHASQKGGRNDLSSDVDTIDRLMKTAAFRAAFRDGAEAHEGFYAFENQMSDRTPEFDAIVANLRLLARQIEFMLQTYTIEDQELFDAFKRLEGLLMTLERSGPGYDEAKGLCRFIYDIFAGWSFITGDTGDDLIEKRIQEI